MLQRSSCLHSRRCSGLQAAAQAAQAWEVGTAAVGLAPGVSDAAGLAAMLQTQCVQSSSSEATSWEAIASNLETVDMAGMKKTVSKRGPLLDSTTSSRSAQQEGLAAKPERQAPSAKAATPLKFTQKAILQLLDFVPSKRADAAGVAVDVQSKYLTSLKSWPEEGLPLTELQPKVLTPSFHGTHATLNHCIESWCNLLVCSGFATQSNDRLYMCLAIVSSLSA